MSATAQRQFAAQARTTRTVKPKPATAAKPKAATAKPTSTAKTDKPVKPFLMQVVSNRGNWMSYGRRASLKLASETIARRAPVLGREMRVVEVASGKVVASAKPKAAAK